MKPIGLLASVVWFGAPAVIFSASILGLLPWMIRHGYSNFTTFNVTFGGPLALMLLAALAVYRLEGHPWAWPAFRDRLRLATPTGRDWLWTLGLVAATIALGRLIQPVAQLFVGVKLYTPPAEFTAFMGGLMDFGGMPLRGRWDIFAFVVLALLVLNVGGEELWWRGIILPRQELALGAWAWLVNGLLWDLFHIFYHNSAATIVSYLASTVPIAFVAWRTKNTWPGVIAHVVGNSAFPLAIVREVSGRTG